MGFYVLSNTQQFFRTMRNNGENINNVIVCSDKMRYETTDENTITVEYNKLYTPTSVRVVFVLISYF